MDLGSKRIISFIFKRSGKSKLTKSELSLSLSIDLNWFSPEVANKFIDDVIWHELLIKDNEYLKPNFDIYKINISFVFKPNKNYSPINYDFIENKINLDIFDIITQKQNYNLEDKNRIKSDISNNVNKKNIISNVSALLIFKKEKIDITEYIELVEKQIFS